jgi:hypothetical protein
LRARRAAKDVVPVIVWLPKAAAPEFKLAAKRVCEKPTLRLAMLTDSETGRFVSLTHTHKREPARRSARVTAVAASEARGAR